jgi:hypothetical protein
MLVLNREMNTNNYNYQNMDDYYHKATVLNYDFYYRQYISLNISHIN